MGRTVVYSMSMSLDGYIIGPDGGFDWSVPDEEVFQLAIDEVRGVDVHLLGRNLYGTMLYWETAGEDGSLDGKEREFADIWKHLPKVVFSRTLPSVEGTNTRLAVNTLAEEITRLKAEPGSGDIAVGGAGLAAEAAALDLIDEYRIRIYPVLVGGGTPFFPRADQRVELDLVESTTLGSTVVLVRYRVVRRD